MRQLVCKVLKVLACLSFLLCFAVFAQAHKVNIFATLDGNMIVGKVYFSGGGMAENVDVDVLSIDNLKIAKVTTNGKGEFMFVPKAKDTQYTFSVDTGDGHAAKTTVAVTGTPGIGATGARPPSFQQLKTRAPGSDSASVVSQSPGLQQLVIDPEIIAGAVGGELSKQLRPIAERLDKYESRVRFSEILGGLGYIVGIAGIVAFFLARREAAKGKDKDSKK